MALTKRGQLFRYGSLTFYAWGGVIVLHDEEAGDDLCCTVREWKERIEAMMAELKATHRTDEAADMRRAVASMFQCWQQAKDQGDPTDPEVQAYLAKHKPKRPVIAGHRFSSPLPARLRGVPDLAACLTSR